MVRMKNLVFMAILSLALIGCSISKNQAIDKISSRLPSEIYTSAQKKLQEGNFREAIVQLETFNNLYPYSPCFQQVQLDLIYACYKNRNLLMAQTTIDRFIRLNPTHPNIDYVIYMKGLINMALDHSILQEFFGIDRSDRNPEYARAALRDFTQLLRTYPDSRYAADAYKRLVYLKNRLAKYELSIVKFYTKREAYIAVINRVEQMIKDYPDTQAIRIALPLMKNAYRKLQLFSEEKKVAEIISAN